MRREGRPLYRIVELLSGTEVYRKVRFTDYSACRKSYIQVMVCC